MLFRRRKNKIFALRILSELPEPAALTHRLPAEALKCPVREQL
ncbi:Uncharacterized protein dnm_027070 [Desulfonema magnum]|uniref:Uncharacterized protein n=1 Tax=Desulfonema magnum TaxID=45655 RepID=A0A975GNA7_9BACT|nr:Uncharacterized protein dnm_027070 [Desulfonema magnum]